MTIRARLLLAFALAMGVDSCRAPAHAHLPAPTLVRVDVVPAPERTRRDNRPEATPIPNWPILGLDPIPAVIRPAKRERSITMPITCRRLDLLADVRRCRIWVWPPGAPAAPKTPSHCASIVSLVDDHEGTMRCRFSHRAPLGLYTACPFVPDEPGAAYAGLFDPTQCRTFEVRYAP